MNTTPTPTPPPAAPATTAMVIERLTKKILDCYAYPIDVEQQEAARLAITHLTALSRDRAKLEWVANELNIARTFPAYSEVVKNDIARLYRHITAFEGGDV